MTRTSPAAPQEKRQRGGGQKPPAAAANAQQQRQAEPDAVVEETTPLEPAADEVPPAESTAHPAKNAKPVELDPSYVERPYTDAVTDEHRAALEEAGLL